MNPYLRNAVTRMPGAAVEAFAAGFGPVTWVKAFCLGCCALSFVVVALNLLTFHHERKAIP